MLLPRAHWAIVAAALVSTASLTVSAAAFVTSIKLTDTGNEQVVQPGLLPPSPSGTDPLTDFGIGFDDVQFPAVDGSSMSGWLVPGSHPDYGIVTVHGRGADRRDFLTRLPVLHDLGATVLMFDLRGQGLSEGPYGGMSMGYRETQDVQSAVSYLRSTGATKIVVIGMSLGAGAAIIAAAEDPAINGVIAESAYTSMFDYIQQMADQTGGHKPLWPQLTRAIQWPKLVVGLTEWRQGIPQLTSPVDVVARISPRPLLLMHGTADRAFFPEMSNRLYARAGQPKDLWLADGAEHTGIYELYPAEYRNRVAALTDKVFRS